MLAGAEWLFAAIFYNYLAMKGLIVVQLRNYDNRDEQLLEMYQIKINDIAHRRLQDLDPKRGWLLTWQEECQIIKIITLEKFWLWLTNYESFTTWTIYFTILYQRILVRNEKNSILGCNFIFAAWWSGVHGMLW